MVSLCKERIHLVKYDENLAMASYSRIQTESLHDIFNCIKASIAADFVIQNRMWFIWLNRIEI